MIVRVPALAGMGEYCPEASIPSFCDVTKTQEFGCACADEWGNLLDSSGRPTFDTGSGSFIQPAAKTAVFGLPGLDAKTLGIAAGVLVVLLMTRGRG